MGDVMAPYIYWFMLALLLLGLEMATGTFYMVVLSVAASIGGIAALTGLDMTLQITLAGVAAVAGTVTLRRMRSARPDDAGNPSFDIGQPVQVVAWNDDGTARVRYRGADWDAEPESVDTPHEGTLYIKATQGSKLILSQHKP
jgi:membrane protein implicated in regulation of membrane protease activity